MVDGGGGGGSLTFQLISCPGGIPSAPLQALVQTSQFSRFENYLSEYRYQRF